MMNVVMEAEPITKVLNDFLAPFECEARLGTDFAYYTDDSSITYALLVRDESEEAFQKFVEKLFPNIHAPIFLWSILHELGHHETEDEFEDDEWEDYMALTSMDISNEVYFELDIERAATVWAGEYIQSHVDEVAELWNKLQPAIKNFYSKLNVE